MGTPYVGVANVEVGVARGTAPIGGVEMME